MSDNSCKLVGLIDGGGHDICKRVYSTEANSPTLVTGSGGGLKVRILDETDGKLRVRFLTPLEYWRLMGFDDQDFLNAQAAGVSNAQLYKQAGNSIVVNVLEAIFGELL